MTERVLVTGVTGFVGAAVARAFHTAGYRVRALVRDEARARALHDTGYETALGDLAEPHSLPGALADCSFLAHVAADYRLFVTDPAPLYRVNVDGTLALMRAARSAGIQRIVYTSSVATIGHRDDGRPADETARGRLEDMAGHYKRSKFLAEEAVRKFCAKTGLPTVIVNPSAPVGPGDVKPTPTGRMVLDAARGRMPAYLDTGLNIVHVDDVGEGHRLALERGESGERYILGGENLALREIFTRIAHLGGQRPPRIRLAPGPLVPIAWLAEALARLSHTTPRLTRDELAMARHPMYYSSARAEQRLGYTHRPAEAAFRDALAWFAAAGQLRPDNAPGYTAHRSV
ncbi:MAG: NAD-dependent epimerase/dehydratase family protein [Gammaproteobacteria bacterium]|nr:NAD-dependent epimerase/dehydratase family protein [Gammaproteobacteria bacterium]